MAQEPSSKDLLEAVKQQESGGRRYKADGKTLLEGPQTKYGTAKGEMQVLDMTNKDPGYGVKPAQDNSPDERARVGRDYLNAMVKKYGDRETALVAYNWGPGNTDKWLKAGADPAKLPKETQNYVAKITASLGGTKVASTKVAVGPKADVPPRKTGTGLPQAQLLSQLGPNYQAAIAVSMLADEAEKEGKDEDAPSESERMLAAMPSKPAPAVDLDLSYQSPFPEIQAQAAPVARKPLPLLRPVRMAKGGEVGYFQDPMGVPDSGPVTADTLSKGKEFKAAEALQVLKDIGTNAASNLESILRGAVSQVPGVVGDLESGGRQLLNFSFGPGGVNVGEKTAAPTSSEIRARVPRITATRPESSGMESMGEMMAPGLAKAAAPVAKAAAKGTAKEMLRGIEGQGVLAPISPQNAIMYAAKPRGGTFLTSGSLDLPAASKLDKALEAYADRAIQDAPDAETTKIIRDFIDKKARKYFTTEFATGADPIRTAISSGEISPIGRDVERFPEYLLYSAKNLEAPGHQAAKRDLERAYDQASGVKGSIIGTHDPADADARRLFSERVRLAKEEGSATMAREGTPVELQNPDINTETLSDLSSYTYNELLKNAVLQNSEQFPAVMGAVERTQPIYDFKFSEPLLNMFSAKTVAENIAALPANKLKNMSFADAMIEGSKRMEVSRNYDKAVDLVEKGAVVPKEVVMQYTKPITETSNGQWVQLTDKMATKMEGKMLHHSVGSYAESPTYGHGGAKGFDAGDARVFSLRDPKTGLAKVTVEGKRLDDGRTEITQIKGNFNSFPEQYKEDLFRFFDHMGYKATFPKIMESYRNTPTGGPLETPIYVNWGKEYEAWAKNKPEALQKKEPPGQSQLPGFARGGMVERQVSTARYI